ncbi:hypothetical protein [Azospirillum tabaci]|uniref:hypothetical protein n=1 Tax=Azospirillum tabaci TaxID=2752310 RepID=UPI0016613349|nr:hypothetical protein [Azospirillum tabaci]
MKIKRVVVWFSCGAASAVAAKLALKKYRGEHEVVIAYTDTGAEHPDNERFMADCVRWFNAPVEVLKSPEFADTWAVWEKRKFVSGISGAPCTGELKKAPRWAFERPGDLHVFGFTEEERRRSDRFREQNPDVWLETPLIDAGLRKADCLAMIERAGIAIPAVYLLGFQNNNCLPCPKATSPGYWNRMRRHFPEQFNRMAELSRRLGARLVRVNDERLFLDELDPAIDSSEVEPDIECSILCHIAAQDIAA